MTPPVALTIAGSDSSGGAGVQADLKVFSALGVYGASVLTAVTAQNTRAVTGVFPLPARVVRGQLSTVLDDLPPAAVKTGMFGTAEVTAVVTAAARDGALPRLVVDPVLKSTSGRRLGVLGAVERLLPYATVITPNLDEASALVGWRVSTPAEMAAAAAQLAAGGARFVVVTGGDLADGTDTMDTTDAPDTVDSVDAVCAPQGSWFLRAPRVRSRNTHGSGCSFAAAIAARLALGDCVPDALTFAKAYVARAIGGASGWRLGSGHGPLDHFGWSDAPPALSRVGPGVERVGPGVELADPPRGGQLARESAVRERESAVRERESAVRERESAVRERESAVRESKEAVG